MKDAGVIEVDAGNSGGTGGKGGTTGTPDGGKAGTGGKGGTGGSGGGGTGGSGSGSGGSGGNGGGGCGTCPSPATCDTSGSTPVCKCPDGYKFDSTAGASNPCPDIDECADASLNDCNAHATCTNTDGSYECACKSPAYKGDGKTCECALGYAADSNGACLGNDGQHECTGDADCLHGHCVATICCAVACDSPGLCHTADGVTCPAGDKCEYPKLDDNTTCEDGNVCTSGDKCTNGACAGDGTGVSTSTKCQDDDMCGTSYHCAGDAAGTCQATTVVNCSTFANTCNDAKCAGATGCYSDPKADGTVCINADPCIIGGTCSAGTCAGGVANTCDDGNPCTDDGTCAAGVGCPSPAPNSMPCNDGNPCTTTDTCSAGSCHGTGLKDCNDSNGCTDDACDPNATSADPCTHTNNSASCSDGNSCTANDFCQAGQCSAGADSACGVGVATCTQGNPNVCTCMTGYVVGPNGTCIPNVCDNPSTNPCDAHATCSAQAGGAVSCTCNAGYGGTGFKNADGCTLCASNEIVVNKACVCDMTGTFAVKTVTKLTWSEIAALPGNPAVEAGTNVIATSWALRKQSYDSNGHLTVVGIPCGGTTPDLCSPFFSDSGLGQFLTNTMWGTAQAQTLNTGMNMAYSLGFDLPNARANQDYQEPQVYALLGIRLPHASDAWPAAHTDVGTAQSPGPNGAYMFDDDGDGKPGVSSYAVPPNNGGTIYAITDTQKTTPLSPPKTYGNTSTECPRDSSHAGTYNFNWWPSPADLGQYIAEFHLAQRVTSNLSGKINSCDLVKGDVHGPYMATDAGKTNGQYLSELRMFECLKNDTSKCSDATVTGLDGQDQSQQHVSSATFTIQRVAATATCETVRAMTFQ